MNYSIHQIMNILDGMLDENCDKLNKLIDDEYWQHLTEMKLINMINLLDEEYDPKEDEEYLQSKLVPKRKSTIITRSTKKRQLEKEKSNAHDDDTIEH